MIRSLGKMRHLAFQKTKKTHTTIENPDFKRIASGQQDFQGKEARYNHSFSGRK